MQHRLRNRIIIRCLSSGETGRGTSLMPDDALKLGVTLTWRTPDVASVAYATDAT